MQLVTEDNVTGLAEQRWAHRARPAARGDHDRAGPAPARVRPRGAAHRGRVDGRDPVAEPHRPDQRRQAAGVHPGLRRARAVHAGGADEPPLRPGGHPGHGARARSTSPARPSSEFGADMSDGVPGTPLYVSGTVRDLDGKPVAGAVLDVWQADPDGAYEAQLDVDEARLRAKYTAREDGTLLRAHGGPEGLRHPDGRPGRRPHRAHRDQPLPAGARAFPAHRARPPSR